MPEASHSHVLNGALFAIGKLYLRFPDADAWRLPTLPTRRGRLLHAHAGEFTTNLAWLRWELHALTGMRTTFLTRFRLHRFSIPFRIAEVMVCLDEVVDGEVILSIIEPRTATDNLLELNHRVDWPH